jgi:Zn finger protein HypA/HybF involved in hydrogenase expression
MDPALFRLLKPDTLAEGAIITLTKIPVKMTCQACQASFSADIHSDKIKCPECGNDQTSLTGGDEFLIESIEVI